MVHCGSACLQPERFAAVASLSGALDVSQRCADARWEASRRTGSELQSVFGEDLAVEGTNADLFHLAAELRQSGAQVPKIFMSCGTEDALLGDPAAFREPPAKPGNRPPRRGAPRRPRLDLLGRRNPAGVRVVTMRGAAHLI
jgi:S-formylglutathione hydrolase FrmB